MVRQAVDKADAPGVTPQCFLCGAPLLGPHQCDSIVFCRDQCCNGKPPVPSGWLVQRPCQKRVESSWHTHTCTHGKSTTNQGSLAGAAVSSYTTRGLLCRPPATQANNERSYAAHTGDATAARCKFLGRSSTHVSTGRGP